MLLLVMRNGSSAFQKNNITFVDKRELRGPSPGMNYVSQLMLLFCHLYHYDEENSFSCVIFLTLYVLNQCYLLIL